MQNETSSNNSVGEFFGLLAIAFIVLKLTGFVGWSWWLVLAPLYVPALILIAFSWIGLWVCKMAYHLSKGRPDPKHKRNFKKFQSNKIK